ncbi:polyprenyl synthetase family protein [Oricola sp.]|uniref:polyprenyl synthetase family protein n=1 Tax=Oricola sp. TaxID=1979950 RepID=UPI003BAA39FC
MMNDEFQKVLLARAAEVEHFLSTALGPEPVAGEVTRPERLVAAIRHGALNGGKRIRPFLVLETAKLFGVEDKAAFHAAAALECVHCYSLIHDDLPAMDDDDVRRGQPTVHKAFDEATAILAGDSLLTLAFDLVTDPMSGLSAEIRCELAGSLARAAGIGGMAGGQALDLAASVEKPDENGIVTLQLMKTGALIRYACEAGAILAGAADEDRWRLVRYGETIGLAFQLADDLLDVTQSADAMGKATGKDAAAGKGTLVALRGTGWARGELDRLVAQAEDALAPFGERAGILVETARFVAYRQS